MQAKSLRQHSYPLNTGILANAIFPGIRPKGFLGKLSLLALVIGPSILNAANYYVAPKLSSGSGTLGDPFGIPDLTNSSIYAVTAPALTALRPGDMLFFRGGDYHFTGSVGVANTVQLLGPSVSGTASQPITFRSYPGEAVNVFEDSGTQPIFGTELPTLDYVRFIGLTVHMSPDYHAPGFRISGTGNEVGYCEVIGTNVASADNHDGIRIDYAQNAWIHHNNIHSITGPVGAYNSAGIKCYDDGHILIEDNYIHDNTCGVFDKDGGLIRPEPDGFHQSIYRRNYIVNNVERDFVGPLQGALSNYYVYDNVIGGTFNIGGFNEDSQIYNNLFLTLGPITGYQTANGYGWFWGNMSNSYRQNIWNNIVFAPNSKLTAFYNIAITYVQSGPNAPISYMDYNVYTGTPNYQFGGGTTFTFPQMQSQGFEQHTSVVSGPLNIYQDLTAYQLLPQWQTAGRYGDSVGPRFPIAQILDVSRYGPQAAPAFAISTASLLNGSISTPYSQTLNASGGTTPYTWSVSSGTLPAGLAINSSTGVLSDTPSAIGTFNFTIMVTDDVGATATRAYSIVINPALAITTVSLPNDTLGNAYAQTLAASGGTTPYTWSISAGALPTGLDLNSFTGVLSGTPSTAGTFNFTIKVTDNVSATATQAYSVVINPLNIPLSIVSAPLPNGTIGSAYTFTFTQSGGNAPFTWSLSAGALPPGLSFTTNGNLSGTPITVGAFNFTVAVSDATPSSISAPVTLTIQDGAPAITSILTATPPQQVTGGSVNFSIGVTDPGSEALTYAWTFGDGGTDTSTSPIHVYTTAGIFTVQVTVTNTDGLNVSNSISVTIVDGSGGDGGSAGGGSGSGLGTSLNPLMMTVSKLHGSIKPGGHDDVSITGFLPDVLKGFDPTGKTLIVDIGGASATFTLNSKGQDRINNGAAVLKFKPVIRNKKTRNFVFMGGNVAYAFKLQNGSWAATWGLPSGGTSTGKMTLTSTITLDGTVYAAAATINYSMKGKGGGKFGK